MCSNGIMFKIEKGKKIMSSVFARFGSSNAVPVQPAAFAGSVGIHGENSLTAGKKNKEKKG